MGHRSALCLFERLGGENGQIDLHTTPNVTYYGTAVLALLPACELLLLGGETPSLGCGLYELPSEL